MEHATDGKKQAKYVQWKMTQGERDDDMSRTYRVEEAPQQSKRGKNRSIEEAPSAPHVIAEKKQNPNKP
jgi:hypothetical protein